MDDRTILKALDQILSELQKVVDQVEVHDRREEYRQASESVPPVPDKLPSMQILTGRMTSKMS